MGWSHWKVPSSATPSPLEGLLERWRSTSRVMGGGCRAPAADATDGLVDVCTFRRGSLWHGFRYLAAAQVGCHRWLSDYVCCRARRLRITAGEDVALPVGRRPGWDAAGRDRGPAWPGDFDRANVVPLSLRERAGVGEPTGGSGNFPGLVTAGGSNRH